MLDTIVNKIVMGASTLLVLRLEDPLLPGFVKYYWAIDSAEVKILTRLKISADLYRELMLHEGAQLVTNRQEVERLVSKDIL